MSNRVDDSRESGNVLFLILIAVALFAALSYAITFSNTGGSNSTGVKNTQLELKASEISQYLTSLKQVIIRLNARGCDISDISFEGSPFDGSDASYVNSNSPVDFSCHVFHPNGGGFSEWVTKEYQNINQVFSSYRTPRYTATWFIREIGVDLQPELIILIGLNNLDLCKVYNEKHGVTNPGGILPKKAGSHIHTPFAGNYPSSVPAFSTWNAQTLENGHHTACVNYEDRNAVDGMQIIYKVLALQ